MDANMRENAGREREKEVKIITDPLLYINSQPKGERDGLRDKVPCYPACTPTFTRNKPLSSSYSSLHPPPLLT